MRYYINYRIQYNRKLVGFVGISTSNVNKLDIG